MLRRIVGDSMAITVGVIAGLLLVGAILGAQARRHEPGLWTLRFARVLDCGVDYNGPPFTHGSVAVWLTCGPEDSGWQLWPP